MEQMVETDYAKHSMAIQRLTPGCLNSGGTAIACTECGAIERYLTKNEDPLGHDWGEPVFTAASCKEAGGMLQKCTRNGCTETIFTADEKNYPALKHPKEERVLQQIIPASCVAMQQEVYLCKLCGMDIRVSIGEPAPGSHEWIISGENAAKVSCARPGYVDMICNFCGMIKKNQWHQPECAMSDWIVTEECIYRCCLVCGEIESAWVAESFSGFDGCAGVDTRKQATVYLLRASAEQQESAEELYISGAHCEYEVVEGTPATCTEPGTAGYTSCRVCGEIVEQGEAEEALGHDLRVYPAVPATPFSTGKTAGVLCVRCGEWQVVQNEIDKIDLPMMKLPAAMKQIGDEAFAGSVIQCVRLPDGCSSIGSGAFAGCTQLSYAYVPDSVTRIADNAFADCSDLIIVCNEDSAIAQYAAEKGISCICG